MNRNTNLKNMLMVVSLLLAGTLLSQVQAFQSGRPQTPTPPTFPPDQARQAPTPAPPVSGAKWEYRIVYGYFIGVGQFQVSKPSGRTVDLEDEVNALGNQGFEVHAMTPLEAQGTTQGLSVFLKRPKP